MAVFRPNLEWSTYQEKQLKVLESIEDSLDDSISLIRDTHRDVSDIPNTIYHATDLLVRSIDAIWNSRDIPNILDNLHDTTVELESQLMDSQEEFLEQFEEFREEEEEHSREIRDSLISLKDVVKGLNLDRLWERSVESADDFTRLYNETIQMTGATGDEAQAFRRNIINTVDTLNRDLGNALNSKEILSTMIAISSQTSISNRETLEEIAGPMVLAQETMAVNIGQFSELAGKFYTKYNFESSNLESLVDYMRNSTEGKDVDEQVLLNAIDKLETRMAIRTEGDQASMQSMQESLMSGLAWLESNYIDSSSYIDDLYKFMSSDVRDRTSMALKYSNASQIQSQVDSGDMMGALESMLETISNYDVLTASARGIDSELWEEAYATQFSEGFSTLEEYLASIDDSRTAREAVEDKFVSVQDQMNNKLTSITSYLSTIQENLGIGFTDVALLLSVLGNVKSVLSGAFPLGSLPAGRGLLGGLTGSSGLGPALGISGAAIGVAAGVTGLVAAAAGIAAGISDIHKSIKDDEEEVYDDLAQSGDWTEDDKALKLVEDYIVKEDGSLEKSYKTELSSEGSNVQYAKDLKSKNEAEAAALADKYAKTDSWSDLWRIIGVDPDADTGWAKVPLIGTIIGDYEHRAKAKQINDEYVTQHNFAYRYSNATPEEKKMYQAYIDKGLISDYDQMQFMIENFDKFSELNSQGLAAEVSKEGLENPGPREKILGYARGANYIPYDQLAYLHKGEAVVPEQYNPAAHMNELERLREEKTQETNNDTLEMISVLKEIREFMHYWKEDNYRQEALNSAKSMTSQRMNVLGYMKGGW